MKNKGIKIYLIAIMVIALIFTIVFGIQWFQAGKIVNAPSFIDKANVSIMSAYADLSEYEQTKKTTLCCLTITVLTGLLFAGIVVMEKKQEKGKQTAPEVNA